MTPDRLSTARQGVFAIDLREAVFGQLPDSRQHARTRQGVLWLEWLRQGTRALVKWPTLFIAESLGGWDGDGVAGGQQAGEQCAKREESGGCEQTACTKGALHPVREEGAQKAVKRETDNHARGRAYKCDACCIHNTCARDAPSDRCTPNSVVRWATL